MQSLIVVGVNNVVCISEHIAPHQRLVRISCCVDHLTPVLAEIAGVVLLVEEVTVMIS